MSKELKKEKVELGKLSSVSGGTNVGVNLDAVCCKPGRFKILESKENEWEQDGQPEKCKYCWHLKFQNGFYCDA